MAVIVLTLLAGLAVGITQLRSSRDPGKPVLAAEYFGSGSPINLWSTNMSGAEATFQQMKQDGFNAIGLVVPWGEFEEQLNPPRYNASAFARLDRLVALAKRLDMRVVLRLSYELDVDPADHNPNRFESLFAGGSVYEAWLNYVSHVHQSVAKYDNVTMPYLAWEDFWQPVSLARAASTRAERLQLASATGFRSWLRSKYPLADVSKAYGDRFVSWSQVPTPTYDRPAFSLMYKFDDWYLLHRLYEPAAKRFPGLNLEARVDVDPIYSGNEVVGSYSHEATFHLPGTSYVGMYYSPYMGDPSSSPIETTQEALAGLRSTLSSMRTRSGKASVFIFEFEFVSNSPEVATDPALSARDLPSFLRESAPVLRKDTSGYALWVYRDYSLSPVYNPSFTLGGAGWSFTGGTSAGAGWARLPAGGGASQTISTAALGAPSTQHELTVSFSAKSATPASVRVTLGTATGSAVVSGGWRRYEISLPLSSAMTGAKTESVAISTDAPLSVTNVQVFTFTQLGDVYSVGGAPGIALHGLQALNRNLSSS